MGLATNARKYIFYYQNIRGLRTKSKGFYLSTLSMNFDLIALTETWLSPRQLTTEYFCSDYIVSRCDRSMSTSTCERGGGVLIASSRKLNCTEITLADRSIEHVCVKFRSSNRHIIVYCCYVPSTLSIEIRHQLFVRHVDAIRGLKRNACDTVFVMGDFNLPNILWMQNDEDVNYLPINVTTAMETFVMDSFSSDGFRQINGVVNHMNRILDLIFTDDCDSTTVIESQSPLAEPDRFHPPLELTVETYDFHVRSNDDITCAFDFKRADYDALNAHIRSYNHAASNDLDLEAVIDTFYSMLHEGFSRHVPSFTARNSSHPPWHTPELSRLKNRKTKLHKKYIKESTSANYNELCAARSEYASSQSFHYNLYMTDIQDGMITNPKRFWNYVNLKRKTNGYPCSMMLNGECASGDLEIAELFAEFFSSNFQRNSSTSHLTESTTAPYDGFTIRQFTIDEVGSALSSIDVQKGPGPDRIPPIFLRSCASSLAPVLTTIFNESITSCVFPGRWKTSYIIPIFKSGSRNNVANYRGVAILPTVAKLFEKLVYAQMAPFIHARIHNQQHGFVPNRSCTTNLLFFTDYVLKAIEKGQQVDALFADFSKAFDRIPHDKLVSKLISFGFAPPAIEWLVSYLTHRKQYVRIGTINSKQFEVTSGVPQGSHIGPALFIVFVNDIYDALSTTNHLLFADDTKIYTTIDGSTDSVSFQQSINDLATWSGVNSLDLNISKCKIMSFYRKRQPHVTTYFINGTAVERVKSFIDLGVTLDEKLAFNLHYDAIIAKSFAMLGFIKRMCSNMHEPYAIKSLYNAFVRSRLEYASLIWQPHYRVHIQRIESIQKQFLLYALRKLPWQHRFILPQYESRCMLIDLRTLEHRRLIASLTFMFEVWQNNDPIWEQLFVRNTHQRQRRYPRVFAPESSSTNYGATKPTTYLMNIANANAGLFEELTSKQALRTRLKNTPITVIRLRVDS